MRSQILEITKPGYLLSKSRGFVEISCNKEVVGKVVLEDVEAIIVSVPGCLLSSVLIDECCQQNIPLVICGHNYLPSSITLPTQGYGRQFQTMRAQIGLSEPRRKRAWQKIIQAKIHNQAEVLDRAGCADMRLNRLVGKVRSGDPDNCEGQAARIYWQRLFGDDFRRDPNADGLNAALNYIYAVVRGCVARGVSSAGLHPTFSLHHKNPQNPLNLVDDLIEPLRPIADYTLWSCKPEAFSSLNPQNKARLAAIISLNLPTGEEVSPLSLATAKMCRSFANYCLDKQNDLTLPELPYPLDMAAIL